MRKFLSLALVTGSLLAQPLFAQEQPLQQEQQQAETPKEKKDVGKEVYEMMVLETKAVKGVCDSAANELLGDPFPISPLYCGALKKINFDILPNSAEFEKLIEIRLSYPIFPGTPPFKEVIEKSETPLRTFRKMMDEFDAARDYVARLTSDAGAPDTKAIQEKIAYYSDQNRAIQSRLFEALEHIREAKRGPGYGFFFEKAGASLFQALQLMKVPYQPKPSPQSALVEENAVAPPELRVGDLEKLVQAYNDRRGLGLNPEIIPEVMVDIGLTKYDDAQWKWNTWHITPDDETTTEALSVTFNRFARQFFYYDMLDVAYTFWMARETLERTNSMPDSSNYLLEYAAGTVQDPHEASLIDLRRSFFHEGLSLLERITNPLQKMSNLCKKDLPALPYAQRFCTGDVQVKSGPIGEYTVMEMLKKPLPENYDPTDLQYFIDTLLVPALEPAIEMVDKNFPP